MVGSFHGVLYLAESANPAKAPKQGKTAKRLGQEHERRENHAECTGVDGRLDSHGRRYDPKVILKQSFCEHCKHPNEA